VLELVRRTRSDIAEHEQLLEAIVAHRIITLRAPQTWLLVEQLLRLGASRESALDAAREATYAELWDRAHGDAA
jgi:molybdopterin synthase catalytic subunit